jgi:hypothetical protein
MNTIQSYQHSKSERRKLMEDSIIKAWESGKGFDLAGAEPIETHEQWFDPKVVPTILEDDAWDQYCDKALYQLEKALRAFIADAELNPDWKKNHYNRRFRAGQMFTALFNRQATTKDNAYTQKLHKLMAYYSTRIQKSAHDNQRGMTIRQPHYTLSVNALKKPPYGLKLRSEWLIERGEMPRKGNMKPIPDEKLLKPGHSTNPKTDANMQRRSRLAKDKYNEYQQNRKRILLANSTENSGDVDGD